MSALGPTREPPQPPGDHEMENKEQVVREAQNDPLPQPPHLDDGLSLHFFDRWLDGADEKQADDPYPFENPIHDPRPQGVDVDRDVGQLGHERWVSYEERPKPSAVSSQLSAEPDRRRTSPGEWKPPCQRHARGVDCLREADEPAGSGGLAEVGRPGRK